MKLARNGAKVGASSGGKRYVVRDVGRTGCRWYTVAPIRLQSGARVGFDAYVIDLDDIEDHPNAIFVVLSPHPNGLPSSVYTLSTSMEGVPDADVIADAIDAYKSWVAREASRSRSEYRH